MAELFGEGARRGSLDGAVDDVGDATARVDRDPDNDVRGVGVRRESRLRVRRGQELAPGRWRHEPLFGWTGRMRIEDTTITTLAQTGKDMSAKYKETSEGGLAANLVLC